MARWRRRQVAILLVCVLGAPLLTACDPGFGLSARNDTGHVIVVTDGDTDWPMGPGEAVVFEEIGQPDFQATYGILDDTCALIANVTVEWAATPQAVIEVPAAGVPTVSALGGETLPSAQLTEVWGVCGQPGWTFWVDNPTAATYYVREAYGDGGTSPLTAVAPGVAGVAFSFITDEGWFELLDTSCHVVARYHHMGQGVYLGTIGSGSLSVHLGPFPSARYASLSQYEYLGDGCPSTT